MSEIIVLVTGGFDPIHSGHIAYLKDAKKLPVLKFNQKKIHEYKTSDFELINYEHHPKIMAPMNV